MAEGLQIQIGADVTSAIKGLEQVQTELDQTGRSANALSSTVAKTSSSFSKIPQSANQANSAITNLNRVVQDAPFGFIGIQNNIGPLVDSFGQLKMSTGSTSGALRALAGSLIGPAGVGLAVAAISSALTFAIQGFSSWSRSVKEAKSDTDKLGESLAIELVQLTTVVGLAQNVAASQEDRNKAIKLLNEEYGKYLPNLKEESISLSNIAEKYNQVVDAMIRQAVVKGLQEEIAKQVAETAKKIIELQLAREKERLELEKGNKVKNDSLATDNKLKQIADQKNKAISDGVIAYQKQTQAEKAAIGTTNVYDMMIKGLKDSLMQSLAPALNLATAFTDLGQTIKDTKGVEFDFTPIVGFRKLTIEEGKLAEQFEKGILTSSFTKKLQDGFKKLKEIKVPLRINLSEDAIKFQKQLEENGKAIDNFVANVNSSFAAIQVEGIASVGEAIGAALGGGDVKGAFVSFGNIIATGLQAIGKQLIAISGLAELTRDALASLFTNPGLALAAGIGLIAAGAALKASLSGGVKARALGGPVSGGEPYLVGERGPELFVPSVSGGIVPNNSVGSFMGGRMGDSGRGTTLRGQDIILAYARTQRSQLRVNG